MTQRRRRSGPRGSGDAVSRQRCGFAVRTVTGRSDEGLLGAVGAEGVVEAGHSVVLPCSDI